MKTKRYVSTLLVVILIAGCFCGFVACGDKYSKLLDPKNPIEIVLWNYYSGAQATGFNQLVEVFNDTYGREKGIIVTALSQSNINTLADELISSVNGGASSMQTPDVASIYPETAYILKEKDAIVSVEDYLSKSDWNEYITSFLDTGRFSEGGKIYGFPVSKSTEILAFNKTDWEEFETAKNISIDSILTAEDLAAAAKSYYEWTDQKTPDIVEDGKALYGRDSLANYLYVGAARLGHSFFTVDNNGKLTVDLHKQTLKKLWNTYYEPYINGYFFSAEKFRSTDFKLGNILAFTGSSSSVNYIASTVTYSDESSHSIAVELKKPLSFQNEINDTYVQQGASYYVMKSTEAKQYAATMFLKWFTEKEQNLAFSISAGYSPVKKDANTDEALTTTMNNSGTKNEMVLSALKISADIFNNRKTYASPAFDEAKDIREYLESSFANMLIQDRAAVKSAISAGSTRQAAVAQFLTDAYFDAWYDGIVSHINQLIGT